MITVALSLPEEWEEADLPVGATGDGPATTSSRPSAWAAGGPEATTLATQRLAQRTSTTVAPPSVATSRSPARTAADARAAPVRRSTLSVPGCGLPGVPRSAR